jgi:hypothetical protein
MGIDETGDDGVMAQVNDRVITGCTSCGRRHGDGSDPLANNSNVSIRCNVPGAHINEFAGVNNLRFRCWCLLGWGMYGCENCKYREKKTAALLQTVYQAGVLHKN